MCLNVPRPLPLWHVCQLFLQLRSLKVFQFLIRIIGTQLCRRKRQNIARMDDPIAIESRLWPVVCHVAESVGTWNYVGNCVHGLLMSNQWEWLFSWAVHSFGQWRLLLDSLQGCICSRLQAVCIGSAIISETNELANCWCLLNGSLWTSSPCWHFPGTMARELSRRVGVSLERQLNWWWWIGPTTDASNCLPGAPSIHTVWTTRHYAAVWPSWRYSSMTAGA